MADPSVGEPHRNVAFDFSLVRVRSGTTVRLVVKGEVDIATSPRLHEQIEKLSAEDAEIVVFDFERVTFIDSTGLGVLLHANERLGGRLRIVPGPPVTRLLEITATRGKLPIIDLCPDVTRRSLSPRGRPPRGWH
jgi:anti-sigma B factor antagonist